MFDLGGCFVNDNFYKDGYYDWHKDNKTDKIWWTGPIYSVGEIIFSFDKQIAFNFWQDYPEKLTAEQIEIFKKENPELAALKPD